MWPKEAVFTKIFDFSRFSILDRQINPHMDFQAFHTKFLNVLSNPWRFQRSTLHTVTRRDSRNRIRVKKTPCMSQRCLQYTHLLYKYALYFSIESCFPTRMSDRYELEKSQKLCRRLIFNNFRYDTKPLNWICLPIYRTVFHKRLFLLHSYVHQNQHFPPDILTLKTSHSSRVSIRSNHSLSLSVPKCSFDRFLNSALVSTINAFNSLENMAANFRKSQNLWLFEIGYGVY